MSYQPVDVIEVLAWGQRVGAVALNPASGYYSFAYRQDFCDTRFELAPIHMALRTAPYEFPDLPRRTFYGLPALLADALPDTFGNALVDAWMAGNGVTGRQITPLDRLAYAADRGMGALEFRPPAQASGPEPPSAIALADLVLAARATISGNLDGNANTKAALSQLIQVGTSAGGARAKAVVAFNPATSQVRSAYEEHLDGFEDWLVKLDGVSATGMDGHGDRLGQAGGYGQIEYAYHLMAVAAGIDMAGCRLLAEGPRRHFMTRRFDRELDGTKVHLISLCALAHLDYNAVATHSYDQYLLSVRELGLDDAALTQAYRRMVFNVFAVNHDDHTKNLAFLRHRGGNFELAPAYDLTHAYRPVSIWTARHLMAVNGRFEAIGLADIHAVGEHHSVPGYRQVVRDVAAAVRSWTDFAEQAGMTEQAAKLVAADIEAFRPT